jgi:metal-sulfur cluster biosynthetic enzyme
LFYYLLIGIPLLILLGIAGIIYANRRQARVTALVDVAEPDIDLSYQPKLSDGPAEPEPSMERDPELAKLTTEELVMEVLKECQDPEIPLNIVDLGLVYDVTMSKESVTVKMSMTAPDCPSHHTITQDVRAKLEDAGFPDPRVDLVWDPPWTPHRISEEGKKKLGM